MPALEVRGFLRKSRSYDDWNAEFVGNELGLSQGAATKVIGTLEAEGYIEQIKTSVGRAAWTNTVKGNALAQASAAKPIRRDTAKRELEAFLQRVREVRDYEEFIYKVDKAAVFGSYLSDAELLSDVDIAISLVPKIKDQKLFEKAFKARISSAIASGRYFATFVNELCWPQTEVRLFLKHRSRVISLHTIEDLVVAKESQVIYEDSP